MHTHYRAVCDEHKEMCEMFVNHPSKTKLFLGEHDGIIYRWLGIHYGCKLRLVHLDPDLDELWDEYYDVLSTIDHRKGISDRRKQIGLKSEVDKEIK